MIQIGDIVRFKNSYLKELGRRHRKRDWKRFRGEQRLMRVIKLDGSFDLWRMGRKEHYSPMATLDVKREFSWGKMPLRMNCRYLAFVRRPRRAPSPVSRKRAMQDVKPGG